MNHVQHLESTSEVDRLKDVYREYAARGFGQSKWSLQNKGNRAIQNECQMRSRALLQRAGFMPLNHRRILDVGCGNGDRLAAFLDWGAKSENLFGVDLMPDRIRMAQEHHPRISFQLTNAEALPFGDAAFDLVTVFTVFTSILDRTMAANVSHEIQRVLIPGGAVLWYDFRMHSPRNRHVRGIPRRHIGALFPGFKVTVETLSLLPPLARRLGRFTDRLYAPLCAFPFLRTHCLALLTKP